MKENGLSLWLRRWMLPLAMAVGIGIYLVLHYVPSFCEEGYLHIAGRIQPALIGVMLFLQLNVVAPKDLRFHRWHIRLLMIQALLFGALAMTVLFVPKGALRILLECAMLCFICPTAVAAGVVTRKLGGDLPGVLAYTVLANVLACVMIPLMIPIVHPAAEVTFWSSCWAIVQRVFSILVLPCLLAWTIRFLLPGVQRFLARFVDWAFYVWGVCLTLAMSLATSALVQSGIGAWLALGIAAVSLVCCLVQFVLGRHAARLYGRTEYITAGQALGQKNNGFIIWLGFTYMTPVTSVAGGLYALWQNLVNAHELARK